ELYKKDAELTEYYHKTLANGKWDRMMSQTHIGYTYWQQPDENSMPQVKTINLPEAASLGVSIPGSEAWWPNGKLKAMLPTASNIDDHQYSFTVFNRGKETLDFNLKSKENWIILPENEQKTATQTEIPVIIDWDELPQGKSVGSITISHANEKVIIQVPVEKKAASSEDVFYENNGYISIAAPDFTSQITENGISWVIIENLGKTGSSITPMPVNSAPINITSTSPRLEYSINLKDSGIITVQTYLSPTLNYTDREGLKYGIAVDDQDAQIINIHTDDTAPSWGESVANNIRVLETTHKVATAGNHTLKFFMVDTGVVLQKIVIDTGDLEESYLGPPEENIEE
ncbi:MAG: glycosyl hydrolase, partial [Leeuwenhoekiella sp.]